MYNITKEKRTEILNFYYKFQNFFDENVQYVFTEFEKGNDILCDVLLEFYTYFRALKNQLNSFYNYLCEKHLYLEKRKNLEVASGYIPAVSYLISLNKKMEHSIVAIDPLSLPISIEGIDLKRKEFTIDTNIDEYNLLLAHCPCEVLEPLLTKVIDEKKEFTIQTCQCSSDENLNFYSRRDWLYYIDSIMYKASALEDAGFIIEQEYLELSYLLDAPIITARKRSLDATKYHL